MRWHLYPIWYTQTQHSTRKTRSILGVVSPSQSLAVVEPQIRHIASDTLSSLDFKVVFGRNPEVLTRNKTKNNEVIR